MIRSTNILGLFLLIYLWYKHAQWFLSINDASVISVALVSVLKIVPAFVINISFLLLIILYLVHIYWFTAPYLMYTITLILVHILTKISISLLMLEDTTTFLAFKVQHPIPYELQLYHFEYSLFYLIENYCPELFTNKTLIYELQMFLKDNFDLTKIKDKNAENIFTYAVQLLNEFHIQNSIGVCNFPKFAVVFTAILLLFMFRHVIQD